MRKAVLITGAGSGIGAACVNKFSENGYFVFLLGRDRTKLEGVAAGCRYGASILKCDLAIESEVQKAINHCHERPDIDLRALVNNAGIFEQKSFLECVPEDWQKMFQVNLFGTMRLTQGLLPIFLNRGEGSILNVSSTLGIKPTAGTSLYSASKAALNNWTQALALELWGKNVRVNGVCPGIVDTPIHPFHSQKALDKKQSLENLAKLQPMNRIGTPEEIANAIYFLSSEESSWTTGSILSVDGGIGIA